MYIACMVEVQLAIVSVGRKKQIKKTEFNGLDPGDGLGSIGS